MVRTEGRLDLPGGIWKDGHGCHGDVGGGRLLIVAWESGLVVVV